jgi:hypothetical protein
MDWVGFEPTTSAQKLSKAYPKAAGERELSHNAQQLSILLFDA